ncbi:hypothetical protein EMCRGX_G005930 [Ephydatia muelleri]
MDLTLMVIFFSKDQLTNGNYTPTAIHKVLDPRPDPPCEGSQCKVKTATGIKSCNGNVVNPVQYNTIDLKSTAGVETLDPLDTRHSTLSK